MDLHGNLQTELAYRRVYSTHQIARLLRQSDDTVRRLILRGIFLRCHRMRPIRVPVAVLEQYFEESCGYPINLRQQMQTAMSQPLVLTVDEVARELGLSRATVYRWVDNEHLRPCLHLRRLRLPRWELDRLICTDACR